MWQLPPRPGAGWSPRSRLLRVCGKIGVTRSVQTLFPLTVRGQVPVTTYQHDDYQHYVCQHSISRARGSPSPGERAASGPNSCIAALSMKS